LLVYVAWEMRVQGRAFERFAQSTAGLLSSSISGGARRPQSSAVDVTLDSSGARVARRSDEGAIVDVDMSVSPADDTTRGRWLRHVLGAPGPAPREHRGFQPLRLVRTVDVPREDDTPAPDAQRAPILPPPSSSPLRPSQR
jgi:hypothetical protein